MMKASMATRLELDSLRSNTIRTLAIDEVQAANSGHPGTPMALAPLVYTLWNRVLRFDPHDPIWPNRDRFVLSNGHVSMLLWSLLHLTGTQAVNAEYESVGEPAVTLNDIRRFRQFGSKAPGHPEYHWVSGVETTTGPLGQGIATSVGMAIAERWLASRSNRPGFSIFDYHVYAVCGDGCLMEGLGAEAASLAGHLALYEGTGDIQAATMEGRNLHFGIREHAMGAILNGLLLSKLRPFGATFFIFSEYARPAIRLSALMELPAIFAFTHDAMGDREDGPTHQPIEQLASLRAIAGLTVLRPGDANEVFEAYRYAMQLRHRPAALILSRQALPTLDRRKYAGAGGVTPIKTRTRRCRFR